MLNKHLLIKTYHVANNENIVLFKDYRITVLFEKLFRIERNKTEEFCDYATQSVWYRDTPKVNFTVTTRESYIEIATKDVTLHIDDIFENSYVTINGVKAPLNNDENLLGTTRTLDECDGNLHIKSQNRITLNPGVCSKNGVAIIDDTDSLRVLHDGRLIEKSSDEFDIYVFAYGDSYRDAVKALYAITGKTPMLPRYAFGNWWSRYHVYTDEEYLSLMDAFEKYGIPLTVATIDMDWHYADNIDEELGISKNGKRTENRGTAMQRRLGWTGYSWNKNLFPDYKSFLRELHERNLKVTLNLHPADGVRYFEDMYEDMANAMGVDPKSENVIKFDIANDDFINNYFDILHHPYEQDGVDFWWIDWQQGTKSTMVGLDPLWALNHYHYYDNARDGKQALIMSRYAGIGSHRYPIGFSGDTVISWETLAFMPYFTSTAANAGYTWWGHDIGGHFFGEKDDELYLRFLQFGVFNPINRLHCSQYVMLTKEPWAYKNGISELAREAMILRHKMIPMLHTANYHTSELGKALVEPMYYEYPKCRAAYEANDQYLFANDYIVAPITKHSEDKHLTRKKVWLPEGMWTDLFTNDEYCVKNGGKWITVVRPLDSIPVFARAGAIMPLSNDKGNSVANPCDLEFSVYSGNNTYELYEDDDKGTKAFTTVTATEIKGGQNVSICFAGDFSVLPHKRDITLTFKNIVVNTPVDLAIGLTEKRRATVMVTKNGVQINAKIAKYDTISVKITDIDYNATYEVRVKCNDMPEICKARRDVLMKLLLLEGSFSVRMDLYNKVKSADNIDDLCQAISNSDMEKIEKSRLLETFLNVN